MAGLYIHIPFCKSRCLYCGFYSTTNASLMADYTEALCQEMLMRKDELHGEPITTVYFGGGTPSLLSEPLLKKLFLQIYKVYAPAREAEVTLECNPDDVTPNFITCLRQLPVNRVSMGAQSFSEHHLAFVRRRHHAHQIEQAVRLLRMANIRNISIDLMFGFPNETLKEWESDLQQALDLKTEHLSAYCLTYERGTPLYKMLHENKVKEADEELSRQMYYLMIDTLTAAGYEHYEISNFARIGFRSRHNSCYWNDTPYLGLGAAAHSYLNGSRMWNVANIKSYIKQLNNGQLAVEEREILDSNMHYDDRIATALRTREGIDLNALKRDFGIDYAQYFLSTAQKHIKANLLQLHENHISLTRQGLFVSDGIMADLMHPDPTPY